MVIKTRSYTHEYDNRRWHSSDLGSNWSYVGFSRESHLSEVTADYPKWDWKAKIARGENCTSFMSATQSGYRSRPLSGTIKDILGRLNIRPSTEGFGELSLISWTLLSGKPNVTTRSWVKGHIWRAGLTLPSADASLLTKVENQALTKFNARVLKASRTLTGQVVLGELGEALRMIRSPARALRNGVDDYLAILKKRGRSNRSSTARAIVGIAADTWLEYSFGWKPLINDIKDGYKLIADSQQLRPERIPVKYLGFGKKTTVGAVDGPSSTDGYVRMKYTRETRTNYVGVKFYGAVGIIPKMDGLIDYSKAGFTWNEIIPTIWELIPYSFLVDYFTNIGDVINSYAACQLDVRWMSKGTVQVSESSWNDVTLTPEVPSNQQYVVLRRTPGSRCYKVKRSISRDVYSGSRIPRLEFEIPGMSTKWLNIAALASSSKLARDQLFKFEEFKFFRKLKM